MKHLLTVIFLLLTLQATSHKAEREVTEKIVQTYFETYEAVISHIKAYEGLHFDKKGHSGYGHVGETANLTEKQADSLLRCDFEHRLQQLRNYKGAEKYNEKQLLYLAALAYNAGIGTAKRVISGKRSHISVCRYKGKAHKKLVERRWFEIRGILRNKF